MAEDKRHMTTFGFRVLGFRVFRAEDKRHMTTLISEGSVRGIRNSKDYKPWTLNPKPQAPNPKS